MNVGDDGFLKPGNAMYCFAPLEMLLFGGGAFGLLSDREFMNASHVYAPNFNIL